MTVLMPGAAWLPIDDASGNFRRGGMGTIRMYVPHIAQGNSPLHDFFNTPKPPARKASAHGWVGRDGSSEQYVSLDDTAYAVGNWNRVAISWESAGVADDPLSDAQIEVHARNLASLRAMGHPIPLAVNSDDPNGDGVTPHCILGGGHTCPNPDGNRPGPIEAQYPLIVARAAQIEGNPVPAPPHPEDETVQLIYVVQKGKDGAPSGPVYLSWGREARQVSAFSDEEYVEWLLGNKIIPAGAGSAKITDAAGQTRDVVLADNLAAFGVK